MSDAESFGELLERIRRGDASAANRLVRNYEQDIRIAIRTRLSDPALRRQFDSMDICQSVLASFFFRVAAGQYDLHEPGQLVALLTRMAHNKLAMHARSMYRQRRDVRRTTGESDWAATSPDHADTTPTPDEMAVDRDLVDRAYSLMDPEVRQIAARRVEGESWAQIAHHLGGTAEARRKQFCRAMDRIAEKLDVD